MSAWVCAFFIALVGTSAFAQTPDESCSVYLSIPLAVQKAVSQKSATLENLLSEKAAYDELWGAKAKAVPEPVKPKGLFARFRNDRQKPVDTSYVPVGNQIRMQELSTDIATARKDLIEELETYLLRIDPKARAQRKILDEITKLINQGNRALKNLDDAIDLEAYSKDENAPTRTIYQDRRSGPFNLPETIQVARLSVEQFFNVAGKAARVINKVDPDGALINSLALNMPFVQILNDSAATDPETKLLALNYRIYLVITIAANFETAMQAQLDKELRAVHEAADPESGVNAQVEEGNIVRRWLKQFDDRTPWQRLGTQGPQIYHPRALKNVK